MKTFTTKTFVTVLFSLFALPAISQQNFIEFLDNARTSLNSTQQQKFSTTENNSFYKNVSIVRLNPIQKSISNQYLTFNLPDYSCDLKFAYRPSSYKSADNYTWYGEIENQNDKECGFGSILYVEKDGKTYGQIEVMNNVYEFFDIGDGKHIFYQVREEVFETEDCATSQSMEKGSITENEIFISPQRETCPGRATISVLYLFTTSANNAVADIEAVADLSLQQMNQSLFNSYVDDEDMEFEMVDVLPIPITNFNELNIHSDLQILETNSSVASLRQSTQADLVVLLTNGNYGDFRGIATQGWSFDDAFCISQVGAATSSKTAAHEVGHMLESYHHDQTATLSINRGYLMPSFLGLWRKGTLLVSGKHYKRRVLHYSNPQVEYNGHETGEWGSSFNARHFETAGAIVANHFPNPTPPFSVYLSGESTICRYGFRIYEANVTCGEPPLSFHWELTDDGINWNTVSTASELDLMLQGQYSVGTYLTLRLTVTDSNGNSITRLKGIQVIQGDKFECLGVEPLKSEFEATIYPNPSNYSSSLTLDIKENVNGKLMIQVVDSYGNISLVKEFGNQRKALAITTGNLKQNGLYYVNIYIDNVLQKTLPLTIIN